MSKPHYGYCAVTADFLHIGHIEFLRLCSEECERLIVGIMTDDYIETHKKRTPIMNQFQRAEVVKSLKFVYNVVFQGTYHFGHTILLAKNYWTGEFIILDSDEHSREGADIIIPGGIQRKQGISSTLIRNRLYENTDSSELSL